MKKLIAISILMFGMNVNAQDTECKVTIVVTFFNVENPKSVLISESKSISPEDIAIKNNVRIYSLNPSQDYEFIFNKDDKSKIFLLKTSNECNNTLYVNVHMTKKGSATSFWENGAYKHVYFDDEKKSK